MYFFAFAFYFQASRNIAWTKTMSESKFKDHVEYALPKLKRSLNDGKSSEPIVKYEAGEHDSNALIC